MSSNPFDAADAAFQAEKIEAGAKAPAQASGPELERVDAPGEYDLREESYHADPCPEPSLSASITKVLVKRSPRHAWTDHPRLNPNFQREEKANLDMGSMFHKLILGKGAEIETFPAENWTKAGGEGRKFKAGCRERGTLPVLEHQLESAEAMVRAVRAQIPLFEELHYALAGGAPERTIVWQEETAFGTIWCRAMLDWRIHAGLLYPDWKWTAGGAGPEEWGSKLLWQNDCDIQAAFYRRGIERVFGQDAHIIFAVAESEPPYALACHRPTPMAVAMAMRKVEWAIQVWGLCLQRNRWPGYRTETSWQEAPPWREKSFLEREERGEFEIDTTRLMVEALGDSPKGEKVAVDDGERDAFGLAPVETGE
jgi:hypothetical protein